MRGTPWAASRSWPGPGKAAADPAPRIPAAGRAPEGAARRPGARARRWVIQGKRRARCLRWVSGAAGRASRRCCPWRRCSEQPVRQPGHGGRQVLAVIQHDEHAAVADMLGHRHRRVLPGVLRHAERAGHGLADQARVGDRRELHPAHAAWELRPRRAGGGQRQPGLAGAAGPGQAHQPAAGEGVDHLLQLPLPPDQRDQPHRKPIGVQRRHRARPPHPGAKRRAVPMCARSRWLRCRTRTAPYSAIRDNPDRRMMTASGSGAAASTAARVSGRDGQPAGSGVTASPARSWLLPLVPYS